MASETDRLGVASKAGCAPKRFPSKLADLAASVLRESPPMTTLEIAKPALFGVAGRAACVREAAQPTSATGRAE